MAKKTRSAANRAPKSYRGSPKKVRQAFSKARLSKVARRLGVSGRSKMNKKQLVGAIQKADRKAAKKKA
jgi:hypothetical protein